MAPLAPEFEVVSADNQYGCNDWANSHRLQAYQLMNRRLEKNSKTSRNMLM